VDLNQNSHGSNSADSRPESGRPELRHLTVKRKNAQFRVPLRLAWAGRLFAESENKKGDRDYFLPVTQINKEKSARKTTIPLPQMNISCRVSCDRLLRFASHFRGCRKTWEKYSYHRSAQSPRIPRNWSIGPVVRFGLGTFEEVLRKNRDEHPTHRYG
jgi:hypothetical protein